MRVDRPFLIDVLSIMYLMLERLFGSNMGIDAKRTDPCKTVFVLRTNVVFVRFGGSRSNQQIRHTIDLGAGSIC